MLKIKSNILSLLLMISALALSACGGDKTVESILPNQTSSCDAEIIKDQFIVQWSNGKITLEKPQSLDLFKKNFVPANLSKIRRIEYNQRFFVSQINSAATGVSGLDNWGYEAVGVAAVWSRGFRGQNTVVAVIDSGIDITHPLLKNQLYVNSNEKPGNLIDDDNNGYVDDISGYDFVAKSGTMVDDIGHGTHVSGIVGGEHNETSVTNDQALGMAPSAKILPLRFLSKNGGTLNDALLALDYVKTTPAKIVNASWGGEGCSKILSDKIAELGESGILFIAAAGNNGSNIDRFPEYPAAFKLDNQITVGSVSPMNGMSSFSNYSSSLVHIFAPGFEIYSAIPGGKLAAHSGTSMAAPFVAGAAALIQSEFTNISMAELKQKILSFVTTNPDYLNATQGRLKF